MNSQILVRRLIYIAAMVLLLFPIYMLGHPSVRNSAGTELTPGGALASIRSQYELGQADLGAIDPASESMRLATLGMRGVAVSILWQRAEYYKREQFWDNYSATLNQITRLEPHFVKVWDFLSWNLSYNISVEFDDYRQRYAWVKKGIDYLLVGTKYNRKKTDLPYELGWKFGNKFGVSDEKVQFRQLYRMDDDWHNELREKDMDVKQPDALGPDQRPDSWLTGRLYYERCYSMVNGGAQPHKSATNFYRMGPMWLINYAAMIATEGHLGQSSKFAWVRAADSWVNFGNIIMRSTWGEDLKMNDIDVANKQLADAKAAFYEYCKETNEAMRADRMETLTDEEKAVLKVPDLQRTSDEVFLAMGAEQKLLVPYRDVAARMPADKQFKANELAIRVDKAQEFVQHIEVYRNQVNFQYWDMRCKAEQTEPALNARADLYAASQALQRGELDAAMAKYQSAFKSWNDLFNRFPSMMTDESAEEVQKAIKRYRQISDEALGSDFVLNDFIKFREEYESANADPRLQQVLADWNKVDRGAYFKRVSELKAAQAAAQAAAAAAEVPPESQPATDKPTETKPAETKPVEPQPAAEAKPTPEAKPAEVKAALPDAGAAPAPATEKAATKPSANEPPPVAVPEEPDFK